MKRKWLHSSIATWLKKKLFNYSTIQPFTSGFTLIELLVVIGILGILAAALVATIDPFEQLKKASDANVKNAMVEYLNANVRWYTTHNAFPWDTAANGGVDCNASTAPNDSQLTSAGMASCIQALVTDKEVKAAFATATRELKEVYVTYDTTNNTIIGCFLPQSESQQRDANTKYTRVGADQAADFCKSDPPGTNNCYWCSR